MPDASQPATLGEILRRAREERGLTIAQIAATTKIQVRLLDALERDDIAAVPGGMYLRADVVAYADAVGLSRDIALDALHRAVAPAPAVETVPPAPAPPPQRHVTRSRIFVAAGAAVVAIAVVSAGVLIWRPGQTAAPIEAVAPAATASQHASIPEIARATTGLVDAPAAAAILETPAASETPGVPADAAASVARDPELEIVTEPAGARVTIDGVGWGVTPVTIKYLPPGTKRVRVTRDGFATVERVIQFAAGQPRTVITVALTPEG